MRDTDLAHGPGRVAVVPLTEAGGDAFRYQRHERVKVLWQVVSPEPGEASDHSAAYIHPDRSRDDGALRSDNTPDRSTHTNMSIRHQGKRVHDKGKPRRLLRLQNG